MRHSAILVFANKQDLVSCSSAGHRYFAALLTRSHDHLPTTSLQPPSRQRNALSPAETCEALGLLQMKGRKWHVQGAIATRGEGLYEGLDWLATTLRSMQR